MAVKSFDEIYSGLSADEKKILDNVFAKEPELKGGWLRQDDYSRKQNELKSKEAEYQEAVAYKERMEPWAGKVYSTLESVAEKGWFDLEKGEEHFSDKYTELEKQLETAKLGGDMDPKQVEAIITAKVHEIGKQAGGLTKEEAAALFAVEAKKFVDDGFKEREQDFNTKTIPFIWGGGVQVSILAKHYEDESGKKWTTAETERLFGMMNTDLKFDALALEEKFLEPVRAEKNRAKEIEEEANKRADQILRDRGITNGMPGGGGERVIPQPPQENPIGLLQKVMSESGDKALPDVQDSVRAGVVEGAKELIEAGRA